MKTPHLGQIVLYRTVRPGPHTPEDTGLRFNYMVRPEVEVWRPSIVSRVWGEDCPELNLRVLSDGGPNCDAQRNSVPHISEATDSSFAWKRLDE